MLIFSRTSICSLPKLVGVGIMWRFSGNYTWNTKGELIMDIRGMNTTYYLFRFFDPRIDHCCCCEKPRRAWVITNRAIFDKANLSDSQLYSSIWWFEGLKSWNLIDAYLLFVDVQRRNPERFLLLSPPALKIQDQQQRVRAHYWWRACQQVGLEPLEKPLQTFLLIVQNVPFLRLPYPHDQMYCWRCHHCLPNGEQKRLYLCQWCYSDCNSPKFRPLTFSLRSPISQTSATLW